MIYQPGPYEGGPQGNDKRGCFGKAAAFGLSFIVLVFVFIMGR